jgi:uncharacterized protein YdhG (YjbR/CyaY superfamily)
MADETVDGYLDALPPEFRAAIDTVRAAIRKAAPQAEEVIHYHVPTFKQGIAIVGVGASKSYCSLYTMSPKLMAAMKDELAGYDVHGATVRFTPAKPLPASVVTRIVKARLAENAARGR